MINAYRIKRYNIQAASIQAYILACSIFAISSEMTLLQLSIDVLYFDYLVTSRKPTKFVNWALHL